MKITWTDFLFKWFVHNLLKFSRFLTICVFILSHTKWASLIEWMTTSAWSDPWAFIFADRCTAQEVTSSNMASKVAFDRPLSTRWFQGYPRIFDDPAPIHLWCGSHKVICPYFDICYTNSLCIETFSCVVLTAAHLSLHGSFDIGSLTSLAIVPPVDSFKSLFLDSAWNGLLLGILGRVSNLLPNQYHASRSWPLHFYRLSYMRLIRSAVLRFIVIRC